MSLADSGVMASWWPASVAYPDGQATARARVYVTGDGYVEVYDQAGGTYCWRSRLDFTETPTPPSEMGWPRQPVDLHTDDGLIVVQPLGGCGCGHRLRAWTPPGATRLVPWGVVTT